MSYGQRFACSRVAGGIGRALARAAGVARPELVWRVEGGPAFGNEVATLDLDGRRALLTVEKAVTGPRLAPSFSHVLFLNGMDITALILDDHLRLRQGFARLDDVDRSDAGSLELVWGELAQALDVHAAAEEAVFYPALLRVARRGRRGDQGRGSATTTTSATRSPPRPSARSAATAGGRRSAPRGPPTPSTSARRRTRCSRTSGVPRR